MTDTGYFTDLEKKEHKYLKKVYSFYSAFCSQPAFYSQSAVCSLHFTLSLQFTPGPQSAVCSPQSASWKNRASPPSHMNTSKILQRI